LSLFFLNSFFLGYFVLHRPKQQNPLTVLWIASQLRKRLRRRTGNSRTSQRQSSSLRNDDSHVLGGAAVA
uniref:G_PROTEIN_RECEP_F1_2 domain-containing protein n=1 Tax=Mesocestoides corti TaxID=53468 RepID=A0A5K3G5D3_MESCO